MARTAVQLHVHATTLAPGLVLRPWRLSDAPDVVAIHQDEVLRQWIRSAVDDEAGAVRWVREQQRGWEAGDRYAFAVVEAGDQELVGHVVLKRPVPHGPTAEVAYWIAAHARGRGVAPRALQALTDWAFTTFADDGPARLELLHQADNTASCRVAQKCGYAFAALLPAVPPSHPREGHLHVRLPQT
ncbi:GNAT family N-acetyltransferase [Streptomyces fulvoviolaceus]|uniref:GNAT family N-acetyltransferase n=1 Tax=Streptomyces fulvoviolaceus TaxID=285535 RepID=UPI0004C53F61|nr:GNAT family N-acetyltransferase [Streptomyces fulvoviolaceus]